MADGQVNGRLKDEFGASHLRVRGAVKVMAHLMFGVLALTVDQWLRMSGTDKGILNYLYVSTSNRYPGDAGSIAPWLLPG